MSDHHVYALERALQADADSLNAAMPIGTPVRYWPGVLEGTGVASRIRGPFVVLGGHTVVCWVDGHGACIAASHVQSAASTPTTAG